MLPAETAFLETLSSSLSEKRFVKLVLSRPRQASAGPNDAKQIRARNIHLRGEEMLSLVTRFPTREETHNLTHPDGISFLHAQLNTHFRSAHLFTETETLQLDYSKKGKPMLKRTRETAPAKEAPTSRSEHDRQKRRYIQTDAAWLMEMGVTHSKHEIFPTMSKKWKQINKFAEILSGIFGKLPPNDDEMHVIDFGCGRGLLTFATYELLRDHFGDKVRVTGVELREHLTREAENTARKLGMDGLRFEAGDIADYATGTLTGMIALHACDTATDLALFSGINAKADFLICAPCCHKEIRPQMTVPSPLNAVTRHGIHLGQEADMVTDALRVLFLESRGYDTQLFEFISLEHTAKNKMILAVKGKGDPDALAKAQALKSFYGIERHTLEELLLA
ncbi:MAG: SAM-dependent methyltransferase [Verrucomicrobia bacterium]|nr:SAM-dependent methyltransferase [Verrucomicrobiota bacterium]MCH8511127.1 SAM-dependent methyltransferase [Kiritimatiellia bacterium]